MARRLKEVGRISLRFQKSQCKTACDPEDHKPLSFPGRDKTTSLLVALERWLEPKLEQLHLGRRCMLELQLPWCFRIRRRSCRKLVLHS